MRGRGLIVFIIVNVLVSAGVALGIIAIAGPQNDECPPPMRMDVVITATPDPNVTPEVIYVYPTPLPGQVTVPPGAVETPNTTNVPPPTLDPVVVAPDDPIAQTATALPENCIMHVISEGDTPFGVAEQYGANGFAVMAVNGLTEETASALQIGDILIVPLEGCPLEAVLPEDEPTATETPAETEATEEPEFTLTPSPSPTITLAPTARNAQVEIVQVIGAGDITLESIEIRNNGPMVDMSGWTLSDAHGNIFVFPSDRRLFTGGQLTVSTRVGEDTAIVLFWGRNEAVFGEPGDTVTLANTDGVVQATLRLPAPVELN